RQVPVVVEREDDDQADEPGDRKRDHRWQIAGMTPAAHSASTGRENAGPSVVWQSGHMPWVVSRRSRDSTKFSKSIQRPSSPSSQKQDAADRGIRSPRSEERRK